MAAVIPGDELIAIERRRQVNHEGWSAEHDDEHTNGELLEAAMSYVCASLYDVRDLSYEMWPWDATDFKPDTADPIRNLERAGALIAAEIDRLQRQSPPMIPRAIEHTPSVTLPLRTVLDWFMSSDPFPLGITENNRLVSLLNVAAERYGYTDWVAAFHDTDLKP